LLLATLASFQKCDKNESMPAIEVSLPLPLVEIDNEAKTTCLYPKLGKQPQ
jgi:hypothetical protein